MNKAQREQLKKKSEPMLEQGDRLRNAANFVTTCDDALTAFTETADWELWVDGDLDKVDINVNGRSLKLNRDATEVVWMLPATELRIAVRKAIIAALRKTRNALLVKYDDVLIELCGEPDGTAATRKPRRVHIREKEAT